MSAAAEPLAAREPRVKHIALAEPALVRRFELLTTARDGVSRLRELILTLAVKGKLAKQDPEDERASMLLERVRAKRDELVAQGHIKRAKPEALSELRDPPFDAPNGWEWACAADVCVVVTDGDHQAPPKADSGVPFLVIGDVRDGSVGLDAATRFVRQEYFDGLDWAKKPLVGDVLYTTVGSLGIPVPIVRQDSFCFQRHIALFRPALREMQGFMTLALQSRLAFEQAERGATGIAQKTVPLSVLRNLHLPLPPLAEQHRIVARVEELMKLCDALEQSGRLADEQHARLTSTLFDALAASESAHALAENWERVAEHFDLLLDRPEAVDALEQTIIQVAVEGALVGPGRSSGEWRERTLGEVVDLLNGYAFKSEWFRSTGVRLVRNVNVSHGSLVWSDAACVEWTVANELSRFALAAGDVVLSLDRPIISTGLKYAVVQQQDLPCLLLQRVARLKPLANVLTREYLELWLISPQFVGRIDPGRSNGVPHISTRQLQAIPTALPPLAEQCRIVARVEELRLLCGDLRKRIGQARHTQTRLADALVVGVA